MGTQAVRPRLTAIMPATLRSARRRGARWGCAHMRQHSSKLPKRQASCRELSQRFIAASFTLHGARACCTQAP